ncbi:hypothetical protein [Novosphingobium album (ex Hu et al. 2023)]|uniref:SnoaL-like domain-containing protein n=1 Tax=Novosphingobium album (ex Hu et al. 2023) TaxID=2930093 RepID=A0ABT0B7N5_9SPHN|nr:hypothetical protein [Novosphingobium album (ex Hu et al. 2023)]MCJ2181013.1 hypothetical protein [Novosphingobium album (ex Hu et al. 2023)]
MTASRSIEPVLASLIKSERHMRSEYGTKMVGVMDTVGEHPHFVMPLEPGNMAILSGFDTIDAMYKGSVERADPKASRVIKQLASDWYVFIENVPTRYWIEAAKPVTAQTVTMFVTDDPNGITGEYAWQRAYVTPPAEAAPGEVPLPERELTNLKKHDSLLAALAVGDIAAIRALLETQCVWAQRDYMQDVKGGAVTDLRSATSALDYIARWHSTMQPQKVSVINRMVTDWYVFSEELWIMQPGGGPARQCRTATVYPLSVGGLFEGALGFGRDMEDPAPSAAIKLGHAYWTEPGVDIADVPAS